ncbi:MAG: gluconolaconase [Acidobacteria bacterium]|nr:gluconolaconase [Acidobacteriota bacterium]
MRKLIIAVVLVVLCALASFILYRVREGRTRPTPFGWRAYVNTVAGDGSPMFRDAAQGAQAAFADPFGIAVGPDGTVYVSDAGESNRIRKLTPAGVVTTLAGGAEGYADGAGQSASFNSPSGLVVDGRGNVYVADTGNNRIRKITPQGDVSTVAGEGSAGYRDGPAAQARFDAPIGIALDARGNIYVADTYNDCLRMITAAGEVSTIAGAGVAGDVDGEAGAARFDTPCAIAVAPDGTLIVADTGNNRLRMIATDGKVSTLPVLFPAEISPGDISKPIGLTVTHDGYIYVTETDRARIIQIAAGGAARVVAGDGPGYADGLEAARFSQPTGIAIFPKGDRRGDLYVADSGNYLVRRLAQSGDANAVAPIAEPLPRLTSATLAEQSLPWPLDPQQLPHEVVATVGEVRGSFDSKDSRDHLHSGLDVFGAYGEMVRVIRSEKVVSPLANWGFAGLNEGLRLGIISYIHLQVGRDKEARVFADQRFIPVRGDDGKVNRLRIRRGARFRVGDALGTINRMYHVHLIVGPPGAEINPLSLWPVGFSDKVAPQIERDGIQLFDEAGARLVEKRAGRLLVQGKLRIVVDAFDRTDMNSSRRRLGLYRLGYQVLKSDGSTAIGFTTPRTNIEFNRLPGGREAPKITYAEQSGITVYGSTATRFLYEVTNTVRDGRAARGLWDTAELPKGDYILRIIAADFSGNEALEGRDVLIAVR